jgi:hypothetical protein
MDWLIKLLTSDKGLSILVEGLLFIIIAAVVVVCVVKAIDGLSDNDKGNW